MTDDIDELIRQQKNTLEKVRVMQLEQAEENVNKLIRIMEDIKAMRTIRKKKETKK